MQIQIQIEIQLNRKFHKKKIQNTSKKNIKKPKNYFNDKMLELYKGCGDHGGSGVKWAEGRFVSFLGKHMYIYIYSLYSLPLSLLYLLYLCTMRYGTLAMYRTKRGKASCNIVVALLFSFFFFLIFLMKFLVFVFSFLFVCLPC